MSLSAGGEDRGQFAAIGLGMKLVSKVLDGFPRLFRMSAKWIQNNRQLLSVQRAKRGTHHRWVLRSVWLGAVVGVIVLSLLPGHSPIIHVIDQWDLSDKMEHIGAYAVLAFFPVLHERSRLVLRILLGLLAMGIALEFCQLASVDRSFEVGDMLADGVGLLAGCLAGLLPRSWLRQQKRVNKTSLRRALGALRY